MQMSIFSHYNMRNELKILAKDSCGVSISTLPTGDTRSSCCCCNTHILKPLFAAPNHLHDFQEVLVEVRLDFNTPCDLVQSSLFTNYSEHFFLRSTASLSIILAKN